MQILVISDSHGETAQIKKLLEQYADTAQAVLHLGDRDSDLLQLAAQTNLSVYTVAGNCDDGASSPRERSCEFNRRRVFMAHGNKLNINFGVERLVYRAREVSAAVCLYGHTHRSEIFTKDNIFFMNPGSITEPRDHKAPSYGLLYIDDENGNISGEIIHL
jgi:hypothetical protein